MLLGRSGCGKTTLLKSLQGLVRPQSGEVHSEPDGKKKLTAYIPQSLGLVLGLTALDNVLTGALGRVGTLRSLAGLFPDEIVGDAKRLLVQMGLAHKERSIARSLSGGERQRVAIARALMARPKLILADEFVSQLDALTASEMLRMIRSLAAQGTGFLITTHDPELACEFGDRILIMREGRLVYSAPAAASTPASLLEQL
jgi:phosphonate transport system ATP-binding protein